MKRSALAACLAIGFLGSTAMLTAKEPAPGINAKGAFARLKTLAGDWRMDLGGGPAMKAGSRITSGGSVVMETLFAGTDHEMISMCHLDGDDLLMTHHCAAGNQPRLKLDREASKPDRLSCAFVNGTNFDPSRDTYMHSGRMAFLGGGRIESEWAAYKDGKKAGEHKFAMSRP
ncbi:hypothetical protein [Singulisphaera sp. PoT]|uniref:hypothetical protein n=1 Tax=Singulisphaera sp. PoT TaxID=3411797 RepID=UPI003BF57E24